MIEIGDKVIIPAYKSWDEKTGEAYQVIDNIHRIGVVSNLIPLAEKSGQVAEHTDYLAYVVLDEPLGIQDVKTARASQLEKIYVRSGNSEADDGDPGTDREDS